MSINEIKQLLGVKVIISLLIVASVLDYLSIEEQSHLIRYSFIVVNISFVCGFLFFFEITRRIFPYYVIFLFFISLMGLLYSSYLYMRIDSEGSIFDIISVLPSSAMWLLMYIYMRKINSKLNKNK